MQCAESLRVQAYFDGEIDALGAAAVERHAEHCAECGALLEELKLTRDALRRELTLERAPQQLRARLARALERETAAGARPPAPAAARTWRTRAFWTGAAGGLATALAAGVAVFVLAPPFGDPLPDELVSAHVRSLMPEHLTDVVSTDRHTVKPWFAGHADVSPAVADFVTQGYRLVGGRADYFEHQRAAVVVYAHGAHVINVFSWVSGRAALPARSTRSGYHLACWQAGNLEHCAVSDAGWDELLGLQRLLRALDAQDVRDAPAPGTE